MVKPLALPHLVITVDGRSLSVEAGGSVAGALLGTGIAHLRNSPRDGAPRGALCFMGVCQECAIVIDGHIQQACMVAPRNGMTIELRGVV